MAFGGYKFKGYKVVRANLTNNTYANWCLLVHQARIKAFMESCALSGAQWHFSKTNGALAFENHGNVIYRVANGNGEYHDYLSFFQYGDEELYYMISTLGEYYSPFNVGNTPLVLSESRYCGTGYSNTTNRKYKFMSISSALSLSQFSYTGPFSGGSWPSSALSCSSQFTDYEDSDGNWGSIASDTLHGSLLADGTVRLGCVTKGKDIVWFDGKSNNKCCIESGGAFSNYIDPEDTYGLAKIILGVNTSEYSANLTNAKMLNYFNSECLTSSGSRAYYTHSTTTGEYSNLGLVPPYDTLLSGIGQKIPFGEFTLSTLGRTGVQSLNLNHILSKGLIKGELLSGNILMSSAFSSAPTVGSTALGGNLLTVCTSLSNQSGTGLAIHGQSTAQLRPMLSSTGTGECVGICCYVGWDPSNPDITNESSWPELALQE